MDNLGDVLLQSGAAVIAAVGVSGAFFSVVQGLSTWLKARDKAENAVPDRSLDSKLSDLQMAAKAASRLASEVELEIQAQVAAAEKAKEDAERATVLAALSAKERDAIAGLVREQTEAGVDAVGKRDRRRQLINNVVFFVAGVAASVLVTLFVRPLWGG
ncbi:hypothetical protein [Agromyces sp. NBRC 114283]|uniref:hypothetical protein n=1 Tax=Agromyces sp. NBRC 114283 TaxID=2994521 RepID=UPI0025557170|nr:hypothetical protein [Agromyces sp. NBRC 114283]